MESAVTIFNQILKMFLMMSVGFLLFLFILADNLICQIDQYLAEYLSPNVSV